MAVLAPSPSPTDRIYWWARQHALILLIGITAAWLERSGLLLAAMAGASFLAAFRIPDTAGTESHQPLQVRILIFSRILIALGLIFEPHVNSDLIVIALTALSAFQLIEAWRMRKSCSTPPLTALIQQETDALWLVSVIFLVAPLTALGKGIIWLALVRPLWIIVSHWTGPPACTMPWSFSIRLVSSASILALSAPLISAVPPTLAEALLIAGGVGWITLHAIWILRTLRKKTPDSRKDQD